MQNLATGSLNSSPIAILFDFIDLIKITFNKEKLKNIPVKENADIMNYDTASIKLPEINDKVEKTKNLAKKIVKKYIMDLNSLYQYIQSTNTIIIKDKHMGLVTFLAGEDLGFIPPKTGIRSFLLLLSLKLIGRYDGKLFQVNTPEMFLYSKKDCHIADIIAHVYKWIAFKKGLPGFDPFSTQKFKSMNRAHFSTKSLASLSVVEVICLKNAIERDMEATRFIEEVAAEILNQDSTVRFIKASDQQEGTTEASPSSTKESEDTITLSHQTSNPMKKPGSRDKQAVQKQTRPPRHT